MHINIYLVIAITMKCTSARTEIEFDVFGCVCSSEKLNLVSINFNLYSNEQKFIVIEKQLVSYFVEKCFPDICMSGIRYSGSICFVNSNEMLQRRFLCMIAEITYSSWLSSKFTWNSRIAREKFRGNISKVNIHFCTFANFWVNYLFSKFFYFITYFIIVIIIFQWIILLFSFSSRSVLCYTGA